MHRTLTLFALLLAAPASAQLGSSGAEFVEAVRTGNGMRAQELIAASPNKAELLNARDYDGRTALILAAGRRDEEWTGYLISNGADPNIADRDGTTPLIAGARAGFFDGVGWLLAAGARVDAANRGGETALIVAVQARQAQIVRLLLSAGADPDRTDALAGYSARDYAQRDPRARDILKLIEAKKPKR